MEIEGREATEVDHALELWAAAQDQLIKVVEDGGLAALDDLGFVGFMQGCEQIRNRTSLLEHRIVRDAESRRLADTWTQPNLTAVLVQVLRLSHGEAARRVRAAEQVGERVTMTGEPLAPLRPALAAAQRGGDASPEQVDVCVRAIALVDHRGFDPADLDAADTLLAGFTRTFEPKRLRDLAQQVVDRIDPDGSVPQEKLNSGRRHLAFRKLTDGMYACEGRLTGTTGAKLQAVLGPLAKPRVEKITLDDGRQVDEPDPRHHGQRTHDALEEMCDRLLRSGTLPDSGGTPATVIVTMTEADPSTSSGQALQAKRGSGETSDGTPLSTNAVLGLADQADIVTVLLSPLGAVLNLGRTRRCASPAQTLALIARDGGCSFPGCSRPPEWCERHHVVAWVDGGPTSVGNLTLLCSYHHHNFAARGWTCLMTDGLPTWVPPGWIDREQKPIRNTRITARHHTDQLKT